MAIEHNEAKILDVSIPLFELEQRVEQLEGSFSAYQLDAVGLLTLKISDNLNTKYKKYLPNICKELNDLQ